MRISSHEPGSSLAMPQWPAQPGEASHLLLVLRCEVAEHDPPERLLSRALRQGAAVEHMVAEDDHDPELAAVAERFRVELHRQRLPQPVQFLLAGRGQQSGELVHEQECRWVLALLAGRELLPSVDIMLVVERLAAEGLGVEVADAADGVAEMPGEVERVETRVVHREPPRRAVEQRTVFGGGAAVDRRADAAAPDGLSRDALEE